MGFRFHKGISLGKLFRLNISKTGVGGSVGVKGLSLSTGPAGTRVTVGLPGTGLSYTKQIGTGYGLNWLNFLSGAAAAVGLGGAVATQSAPSQSSTISPNVGGIPVPGVGASPAEQALAQGLTAYKAGQTDVAYGYFLNAAPQEPGAAILVADMLTKQQNGDKNQAIMLLEQIIQGNQELPTPLMQKYLADINLEINITPNVTASVPIGSGSAALLLAELYQAQGRINEAIGLLEEIAEVATDPVITLSLCELYTVAGAWEGVLERAKQTESTDNITLSTMIFYGRALQERGLADAAIVVFTNALRRKKDRSPALLHEAMYWRAVLYQANGKASQANKEFQKIYATDPNFRDVAQRLS